MDNLFYKLLEIETRSELKKISKELGIPFAKLLYYGENSIIPQGDDKKKIQSYFKLNDLTYRIKLGDIDFELLDFLGNNFDYSELDFPSDKQENETMKITPAMKTSFGELFQNDCLEVMATMSDESVDMIFADPPFNLDKEYESKINDKLDKDTYLRWTEKWLYECVRILKPGGSIFIWNLPKWNIHVSKILDRFLNFRHWITVDMKYGLPIPKKLYPAHYSLLYFVKGERPNTFTPDRLPLEVCKTCGHELKDYGGYKNKMNPRGISMSDVWHDIYPVRHSKYKNRQSNELPIKLLERVISMSTKENDIIFDPFGGSGTTYVVAEVLGRRWIGSEIGSVDTIVDRFKRLDSVKLQVATVRSEINTLFLPEITELRKKNGFWLPENLK